MVEEASVTTAYVLNQPAGHVKKTKSLIQAASVKPWRDAYSGRESPLWSAFNLFKADNGVRLPA